MKNGYKLILASQSPRRKDLLEQAHFEFTIQLKPVEEIYPDDLPLKQVPEYLAKLKAAPFKETVSDDEIVITADTIVLLNDKIYGKPNGIEGAKAMLHELSGKTHQVITGVSLLSKNKQETFSCTTEVSFKELTAEEISTYVENFKPLDKAGSYAIQEWIGMIGITSIKGDYFNVVGLPLNALYKALQQF